VQTLVPQTAPLAGRGASAEAAHDKTKANVTNTIGIRPGQVTSVFDNKITQEDSTFAATAISHTTNYDNDLSAAETDAKTESQRIVNKLATDTAQLQTAITADKRSIENETTLITDRISTIQNDAATLEGDSTQVETIQSTTDSALTTTANAHVTALDALAAGVSSAGGSLLQGGGQGQQIPQVDFSRRGR
jgi:hypothetical protein